MRSIFNYAKKAFEGNKSDDKVKKFFEEMKEKFDEFVNE